MYRAACTWHSTEMDHVQSAAYVLLKESVILFHIDLVQHAKPLQMLHNIHTCNIKVNFFTECVYAYVRISRTTA